MPDDSAQVKFGSDIADLKAGMADSQAAVKDALDKMDASLQAMTDTSKKTADAVVASNKSISDSFSSLQSSVESNFGRITGTLNNIRQGFIAVTGILAGGALFKSSIDATVNWDSEIGKLSRTLGVTTEKASELAVALKLVGMGSDQYLSLVQRLERQVKTHSETLEKLGIVLKDPVTGNTKDLMDVMTNASAVIAKYADGGDKAQVAMAVFGGKVGDIGPLLRMNNDLMDTARKTLEDLGIKVGKDNVQAMRQYQLELNKFQLSWQSLEMKLGSAIMPLLTTLAKWMNTEGPAAVRYMVNAVGDLAVMFAELIAKVKEFFAFWDSMSKVPTAIKQMGNDTYPVQKGYLTSDYLHGQPGDFGKSPLERNTAAFDAQVGQINQGLQAFKERLASITASSAASKPEGSSENGPTGLSAPDWLTDPDKGGAKGGKGDDVVAQYQQELDRLKDSQQDLNAWSQQMDYAFWNEKLAATKRGSDEWWAIWSKMADLYRNMTDQQQQELKKQADMEIATAKNIAAMKKADADSAIKMDQEKYNTLYSLGVISASQRTQLEKQAYDKEYQDALTAYYNELALLQQQGAETINKQEQVYLQMEKLKQDYLQKMQKAEDQALVAMKQKWDNYATQVGSALTSLVFQHQTMLQTIQSLTERAFTYIVDILLKKLVTAWVTSETAKTTATTAGATARTAAETAEGSGSFLSMITKMVTSWIGGETAKTAATTAGVTTRAAAETAGEATAHAARVLNNVPAVTAEAAVAYAGTFAFMSPFMGPMAAGPAAASMAEVMAMIPMASMNVGAWNVPKDMVAKIHQGEMVVPENYAEGMRSAGTGGAGVGGGENHLHIHAIDSKSFEDQLANSSSKLNQLMKQAFRDFHLRVR